MWLWLSFRRIIFFPIFDVTKLFSVRVLLTGGSGRLGSEIKKLNTNIYAPSHEEFDFTDSDAVEELFKRFRPNFVVHCGAFTDVAKAEKERELCWKTNVEGTHNLLEACKLLGSVHFTFVSTACVFSGKEGNYAESSIPYPANFYGLTKTVAESLVRYSNLDWLIVRTNFVKRGAWSHKKAFEDRWGTYLYADEVAKRVLRLVYLKAKGIVHVCGDKKMSMLELARKYSPNVESLTLEDYYKENPEAPHLTQDMTLRSHYKKFK